MAKELDREVWMKTDEIGEFIDSLEHSAALAEQLKNNVTTWRWLIISLHLSLQGACVCALRGEDTAGITMLTEDSGKKVLQWLEGKRAGNPAGPTPKERLAPLLDLFARVCDQNYLRDPHTLTADESSISDVEFLNRLRNGFIHFVPRGLSLELSGMPRITHHVCNAIQHLAVDQPSFWHLLDGGKRSRIVAALVRLEKGVNAWAIAVLEEAKA